MDRAKNSIAEAAVTAEWASAALAFEQSAAGIVRADADGRVRYANIAFRRLVVRSESELLGTELRCLAHPDHQADEDRCMATLRDGSADSYRLEMRYTLDVGRTIWVDVCGSAQRDPDGELQGVVIVALDITERKQRQVMRRQRESLALQAAGLGMWEWHPPSGAWRVDAEWAKMLGYAIDELTPHVATVKALEHADDRAPFEAKTQPCLDGASAKYSGERRLRHKDGRWIWLLDLGLVIERDAAGHALRVIGTSQDITQRKRDDFALQQSRQRQSLAISS